MDENGKTRLEKMKSWFEDHPLFSVLMFLGTGLAGISTLVTSALVILGTFGVLNLTPYKTNHSQSAETPQSSLAALPASTPAPQLQSNEADTPAIRAEAVHTPAPDAGQLISPTSAIEPVKADHPIAQANTQGSEIRRANLVVQPPAHPPIKLQPFLPGTAPQPSASPAAISTPAQAEPVVSVSPASTPEREELVPVRRAEPVSAHTAQE